MAVDNRADVVLPCDVLYQRVDDETGLRVKTRVRLVAEQVFRFQHNRTGDSHTFLLTAGDLARHEVPYAFGHLHTAQTELCTLFHLCATLGGEHLHREQHVLHDGHGVKQRRTLEQHAYFAVQQTDIFAAHLRQVATVIKNLTAVQRMKTDKRFHQYGLTRTRLTDDHVHLSVPHLRGNMVKDDVPIERLNNILNLYHNNYFVVDRFAV